MKKLTILLSIITLGFGLSAQPVFREKAIPYARAEYIFPRPEGDGYNFITGYDRSSLGVAKLDNNFDSLFFRPSSLQLHIGQIRPAADSGYIIAGGRAYIGGGRAGMAHLSPSGFVLQLGYSNPTGVFSNANSGFQLLPDGNYLTIGMVDSTGGRNRILISKYDPNFNVIWEKAHGEASFALHPVFVSDGVLAVVHYYPDTDYGTFIHKYDFNGNLVWTSNRLGDSNGSPFDFVQTGPNRFVLTQAYQNQGLFAQLICVDSQANIIWSRLYNDLGDSLLYPYFWLHKACAAGDGGTLVMGVFNYALDTLNINQVRSQRIYKYDANGDEEWFYDFAVGNTYLMGQHISVLPDGRILALTSGPASINGKSTSQSYIVESVPDSTTSIRNVPGTLYLTVQPQPARDLLEVVLSAESAATAAFTLADLQGRTLIRRTEALTPGENRFSLPVTQLAAGIYLLRAESEGKVGVKKVMVE